jgi:ATP-dependent protease HslVU (ClpYQ) peptidase subunit
MTCIIGMERGGKVYIGADSIGVDGWQSTIVANTKLFRKGEMLFGAAGSVRMMQIVQYYVELPQHDEAKSDWEYLTVDVTEAIRKSLKDHGHTKVDNNQESGANFLIGYKGHLYHLQDDYAITRAQNGLYALGAGAPYAMGAARAMIDYWPQKKDLAAEDCLKQALAVSNHLCIGVAEPFVVESV